MHVLLRGLAGFSLLLATPALGRAKCGDNPADGDAVARARAAADAACDAQQNGCSSAPDHGAYVRCVATQAKAAAAEGTLPPACKRVVTRCAARSSCGKPRAATCCRTKNPGGAAEKRCTVKRSTGECAAPRGGMACVGSRPSCCDACGPTGCASSTTTTASSTTTSTTLGCHFEAAANGCQGGCPQAGIQCVLVAPEQCDCRLPGCHTCWVTVTDSCTDIPCSFDGDCRTEPNMLCLADKCEVLDGCPTTTSTTTTTTTSLPSCGQSAPACNGSCSANETCFGFGGFCLCASNFCNGGSFPQCDGSCPPGQRCFNAGVQCFCYPDQCSGSRCLCVPPNYEITGCGSCPPGNDQCGFCAEVSQQFCTAGPCTTVDDCPSGDACIDFSSCR